MGIGAINPNGKGYGLVSVHHECFKYIYNTNVRILINVIVWLIINKHIMNEHVARIIIFLHETEWGLAALLHETELVCRCSRHVRCLL